MIDVLAWRRYISERSELMSLETFERFWKVPNREFYVQVCGCSRSTVDHWFTTGSTRRPPTASHQRRLAEAHHYFMAMKNMPNRFPELYAQIASQTASV